MTDAAKTEVLVCTSCRAGRDVEPDGTRPGEALFNALSSGEIAEGVTVKAVDCLSNCTRGCSVVLRSGPKRWSYVYGNLDPQDHADVVREGAMKYHASEEGVVPWRERPEHFRKNCIARIPPFED